MRFRIIKKVSHSYKPEYHFQERFFGFLWCTLRWSSEYEELKKVAEDYVCWVSMPAPKNEVVWEIKL